jgi:phospholipid/cholesterol/gamma-HCH transport system ATP-binding protein
MIKIQGLSKKYGEAAVLSELDLVVESGETVVVLGRSGIGKSVLLKHIIGIAKPDAGEIEVNGAPISRLSGPALYREVLQMGMLFQGAALFDSMTVGENAAFFLQQHSDLSPTEIKERVRQALDMVGLAGTENRMPSELSGGMRKRAALARLIVYRPKVLLYDEPTTGLDPITAMQINELIVKTQQELKGTSIVVTHDILSALYVGDRLALLRDGKIAHIADPDTFLKIDDPIIEFLRRTISADPRSWRPPRAAK